MTDYKEFAKQMRENAIKNEQGNIVCSPELWEEIASVIERAIVPPCKVYGEVWCIVFSPSANKLVIKRGFVDEIKIKHENLNIKIVDCVPVKYANLNITVNENDFGKTVFLAKEEAEEKLKECDNNAR